MLMHVRISMWFCYYAVSYITLFTSVKRCQCYSIYYSMKLHH
jgi:hypothetical protein